MASMGTCKSFNGLKGWGFIDMGGTDVFIHIRDVTGLQPKQGDVLSFDVEARAQDPSKYQAKNISGGTAPREQEGGGMMGGSVTPVQGTGAYEGTVKSFNPMKGFGFIGLSGGGDDVFCHVKDCVGTQAQQGDIVKFDVEASQNNPGKMQAKNVTGGTAALGQGGMMGGQVTPVQGTGAYEGTVKSFNGMKGFGFIALSGGGDDVFVHVKECVGSMPQQGDIVKLDVEPSQSKPGQMQAKNVTGGSAPLGMSGMGGMGGMMGKGMMGGKGMSPYGSYGAMMGGMMGMGGMGKGGMMGMSPYGMMGMGGMGKGW
ncbi:unnamed protein product [Polarella glacialis]|uniref:CSD domain-containing protein n=1 Tax=Polarella glacialis TaxID=89957 RepID=A0A813IFP8_POLGL|nr:unnamed protein product [Polarella glacialis]